MIPSPSESSFETHDAGWAELVRLYDGWLRRRVSCAMRHAGLRPVSEQVAETVQDVYCRLLEGGPTRLRLLQRLGGQRTARYLDRVAENAVADQVRTASSVKRRGVRLCRSRRRQGDARPLSLTDPAPCPERALLFSEARRDLQRRFQALPGLGSRPKRNARILWLALVEGWRSREIARAYGLSARTVDTLIHRLRRELAGQGLRLGRRRGV